jgi:DNA-binding XRE family transcriptional regulator
MRHENKCKRPTCTRREQNGGYCKLHYPLEMAAIGRPIGRVSAAATRVHLERLRSIGVGVPRVSELTGLTTFTLWRILSSRRPNVFASTEATVLAVPLDGMSIGAGGAHVHGLATQRRIRALLAQGHTTQELADEAGTSRETIQKIGSGLRPGCTYATARRVAEAFDRLETTPGTSGIGRRRAQAKGWSPPLAWDEDTIEDPDALPYECDRTPLSREQRVEEAKEILTFGLTNEVAADRLGITVSTLLDYKNNRVRPRGNRKAS